VTRYPATVPASPVSLCPVCGAANLGFATTPTGRPRALCPQCSCLERHRFLTLLLPAVVAERPPSGVVLDVAPSRQVSPLIRAIRPEGYVSMDFDPAADGRLVDIRASLTDIPLPDASVSVLVCYHVLEHVPDDLRAMGEIARVLAPDGVALVQVPWRNAPTDEDPSASPEERLVRFGQADHVRWYGVEFVPRLEASGLRAQELVPEKFLDERVVALLGLMRGERVWLCTPADSPGIDLDALGRRIPEALLDVLVRVLEGSASGTWANGVDGAERWRNEAERWRVRYEQLRGRWPVRVMIAARRPFMAKQVR
jgi:SAM-dependent methyltransferase